MKIFDSCIYRVSLAKVVKDIEDDMLFEEYLKELYEEREEEKAALNENEEIKETENHDKKTGNC